MLHSTINSEFILTREIKMVETLVSAEVLTKSDYATLLQDLKSIIEAGKQRALQAVQKENVRMYWEMGRRILDERLTETAGYQKSIFEDIGRDLSLSETAVKQSVIFFKSYEERCPGVPNLTWSHYRRLAFIKDEKERDWYEQSTSKEKWSRDELVRAIQRNAYAKPLSAKGSGNEVVQLKRPRNNTFVYKALVEKVIDGDTFIVRIDLGFEVLKRQRVRFAQIDAPLIKEKAGRKAFEFVRMKLAQVPFVMLRTNKVDLHGRYVADVFYSLTQTNRDKVFLEGIHLNQELVDRGFAGAL
jgi:endonuclease YncB( thermonuclease family)